MSLPTTLKFHAGRSVRRSNDAGVYVCNYSMFLFLDEIGRAGSKVRFGFIHIPHNWDLDEAVELVRRVLRQCRRPS